MSGDRIRGDDGRFVAVKKEDEVVKTPRPSCSALQNRTCYSRGGIKYVLFGLWALMGAHVLEHGG